MLYLESISNPVGSCDVETLGGKGYSLVKLTKGGFPVPGGFIITTEGYRAFESKLCLTEKYKDVHLRTTFSLQDAEDISEEIIALFRQSPFPDEYLDDIKAYILKMKNNPLFDINFVAIRSSATTEDLGDASFAGMHDTIINVPIEMDAIEKNVIECWASLYTPRAILYRYEKHFPIIDSSIAVVVQRMVPSQKSGVIFSCDPETSSREHISLDGVLGLGEALVSGMVSTDHWSIRKHFPISYNKTELKIVESIINTQQYALYTKKEGGTEKRELGEEGKKPCFTEEEIYKISQYSVDVEKYYGKPMDMEFCIYKDQIYLVQARPITTLLEIPDDLNPLSSSFKPEYHAYVGYNYLQMLTCPWTYCSYCSYVDFFFKDYQMVRYIGGYVFTETAASLYVSPLRNLCYSIFERLMDPEVIDISKEYLQSDFPYYSSTISIKAFTKSIFDIASYIPRKFIYYWFLHFNSDDINNEVKLMSKEILDYNNNLIKELKNNSNHTITLSSLRKNPYTHVYILQHILPFFVMSIMSQMKIVEMLQKYGMKEVDFDAIYSGRRENIANKMNFLVAELHSLINQCDQEENGFTEKLLTLSKNEEEETIKTYISSLSSSTLVSHKQFYEKWNGFMDIFGRRGPGEVMIETPRYEEKPSLIIQMVINTSFTDINEKSPDALERKADEAVEELCSRISPSDAANLRYYLPVARVLFEYREHPKYFVVSALISKRIVILKLADKMLKEGIISERDDVFHFSLDELCDYEQNKLDIPSILPIIAERKRVYIRAKTIRSPRYITSAYTAIVNVSQKTKDETKNLPENVLKGMPTSAGIVEGRAVVVTDPKEGHLQKGDILVAEAADPGWTPLFVPASAAVIAIGGPLTHGCIVAREIGIPCVINVQHLMERIKTGMKLRVDGSKGTVEILEN
ncbi:hypothetical protein WA158_001784 [Blastocystis sp. Blastoise]